jgi:hypothetical protein
VLWIAWWVVVTMVGAAGTVASLNSVRFGRRVAAEMRALDRPRASSYPPLVRTADLPAPVQRYVNKAVTRAEPIRGVTLRHHGRFRPSLDGRWLPVEGVQRFRADSPAFVWWGRVRVAPGIWIDARDRSADATGNMLVAAESTITLADSRGSQIDQSALLRLLGEMTWFPTGLLDARYVHWTAIDDHRASATLRVADHAVTGTFDFGRDDLPAAFTAERYRDVGGGQSALTTFVGRFSDYRAVDGAVVPYRVIASWVLDDRSIEYADLLIDQVEFDGAR